MRNKMKKKMKKLYLPKKINLLGKTYKIKFTNCKCKKCYDEHAGSISYKERIIELHKDLNKNEAEYVLFHELAHFFADYYRLEDSEIFADAFAKYVKHIIKECGYAKK